MIIKKLKAGALQLTLFVAVVIALLLMSFILLIHTHKRFAMQSDFVIETTTNAHGGIHLALQKELMLNDTTLIPLDDTDYSNLKVHRSYWGIFEKIISSSKIKSYDFGKIALVGSQEKQTNNRKALYVEDHNLPLVLVGNTIIQGLAVLPPRGVKSGNIAGQSYYGDQLVYGPTRISGELPKLPHEVIDNLKQIFRSIYDNENFDFIDMSDKLAITNSFFNPTQVIYSNGKIQLDNQTLTGNVIVNSNTEIIVGASSQLTDVILVAPRITIESKVVGAFQAIAENTIVVGKDCTLKYPSALIINEITVSTTTEPPPNHHATTTPPPPNGGKIIAQSPPENNLITTPTTHQDQTATTVSNECSILISNGSIVKGAVVFYNRTEPNNYRPQVTLEKDATVVGEIYCTAILELKGKVFGTVYTSKFLVNHGGSIYQNHIFNASIRIDGLPSEYVGLPFESNKKNIIKWLY